MKTQKPQKTISAEPTAFHPKRVMSLLRDVRLELEQFHRRRISYDELGRYAGQAATTVFEKLQKEEHPQVEALLGWLERLPEHARNMLVTKACRAFPNFENERLSHDPVQIGALRLLLTQPAGLTFVTSENAGIRTFIMTALGHAASMLGPESRPVLGIDLHTPDWFVPVDGITYICSPPPLTPPNDTIEKVWGKLRKAENSLVFINGIVFSQPPSFVEQIFHLASGCNIFVADREQTIVERFGSRISRPAHYINAQLTENNRIQIN